MCNVQCSVLNVIYLMDMARCHLIILYVWFVLSFLWFQIIVFVSHILYLIISVSNNAHVRVEVQMYAVCIFLGKNVIFWMNLWQFHSASEFLMKWSSFFTYYKLHTLRCFRWLFFSSTSIPLIHLNQFFFFIFISSLMWRNVISSININ